MMAAERDCCRQLAGRELVLTADTLRPRDRGHDEFFLFQVLANADATLNVAAAAAHGAAAVDARNDEALDDDALAQSSIHLPSSRRPRAAALRCHGRSRGGSFGTA